MGVRVLRESDGDFAVEAPVALNYNHLHTAFGGSINAVATLAGYALLWFELRSELAHVVISASSIRFLKPIRTSIHAVCQKPTRDCLQAFRARFQERGKASIHLHVQVTESQLVAAQFEATFVALRGSAALPEGTSSDSQSLAPGP